MEQTRNELDEVVGKFPCAEFVLTDQCGTHINTIFDFLNSSCREKCKFGRKVVEFIGDTGCIVAHRGDCIEIFWNVLTGPEVEIDILLTDLFSEFAANNVDWEMIIINRLKMNCAMRLSANVGYSYSECLKYTTGFFRSTEFIIECVSRNGATIKYVDENELTNDIITNAVMNDGYALRYIGKKYWTDDVLTLAINQNYTVVTYVRNHITLEFLLKFVDNKEQVIRYCIELFQDELIPENINVVIGVIEQYSSAIKYIKFVEQLPDEVIISALKDDGSLVIYIKPNQLTYAMACSAVASYGYSLNYIPKHMWTDELILLALESNGCCLK